MRKYKGIRYKIFKKGSFYWVYYYIEGEECRLKSLYKATVKALAFSDIDGYISRLKRGKT